MDAAGIRVARRRRIPWADVALVLPLHVVGRTQPTAALALLTDGTAVAFNGDAASVENRRSAASGARMQPRPRPPRPLGATTLFPLRQPLLGPAQVVLGGVAVAEILVLVWINDLAQHRVPGGLALGLPIVAFSLWLATGFRAVVERLGVDVDERSLRVRARRRDSLDVPWSDIDGFACFPRPEHVGQARVGGRVAMIRAGVARELRVPSISSRRKTLSLDDAERVVAELDEALAGRFLPPAPAPRHRRNLEAVCVVAAGLSFCAAAGGELLVAARANEINARARTVEARVAAVTDAEGRPALTLTLPGGAGTRDALFPADEPDLRPGDVVSVLVDPDDRGDVWFADARWPPAARDESLAGLVLMMLMWLAGPLAVTLAYVLHRRAIPAEEGNEATAGLVSGRGR